MFFVFSHFKTTWSTWKLKNWYFVVPSSHFGTLFSPVALPIVEIYVFNHLFWFFMAKAPSGNTVTVSKMIPIVKLTRLIAKLINKCEFLIKILRFPKYPVNFMSQSGKNQSHLVHSALTRCLWIGWNQPLQKEKSKLPYHREEGDHQILLSTQAHSGRNKQKWKNLSQCLPNHQIQRYLKVDPHTQRSHQEVAEQSNHPPD